MISYNFPQSYDSGSSANCTTASTFEKPNSLKFNVLFGDYLKEIKINNSEGMVKAFDYIFCPHKIFGFAYESTGSDFRKLHHAFILRSCLPGEVGSMISGISPGAEILVRTLTHAGSVRLKTILQKLEKNKFKLSDLPISYYRHLNDLLEIKSNTDFFVDELIAQYEGR